MLILTLAGDSLDSATLKDAFGPDHQVEMIHSQSDLHEAARLVADAEPDLLILDTSLKGFDAKSTIQRILEGKPNTKIVALSDPTAPKVIIKLIAAGAQACLPRHPKIGELRDAVDTVISNRIYISQRLTDNGSPGREKSPAASRHASPGALTARELDILKCLADGRTSRQTAEALGISEKTVETHRGNIKAKLGLNTVAELTKYAVRHKITSLDG